MSDFESHDPQTAAIRRHNETLSAIANLRGAAARLSDLRAKRELTELEQREKAELETRSAARASIGARLFKHFAGKGKQ